MSSSDDPAVIQAFLARLQSDSNLAAEANSSLSSEVKIDEQEPAKPIFEQRESPKPSAGTVTPVAVEEVSVSTTSTPPTGLRPPPPTPETKGMTAREIEPLPPIDEDHNETSLLANASNLSTCVDSTLLSSDLKDLRPSPSLLSPSKLTYKPDRRYDPATESILELMQNESVACYQRTVLEKSKEQALARLAVQGLHIHKQNTQDSVRPAVIGDGSTKDLAQKASPNIDGLASSSNCQDGDENKSFSASTEPFPDLQDGSVVTLDTTNNDEPAASDTSESSSEVNIVVDAPSTPGSYKSATVDASLHQSPDKDGVPLGNIGEDQPVYIANEGESRQDATYFTSWGPPSHRDGAAARIRKTILTHLPPNTDFTLVQSLVFGGAIEDMKIHRAADGAMVAYVTFVDGTACDKYYNAFPNGLDFKHKGRMSTVFVEKGHDVDVISGVMKNYLECGASRVVKAVGADSDWSMRALHKIAAGNQARRNVEAIHDSYRNETRTIIFRFTNIADAVSFRGTMLRSPDWQDAEIQFTTDPCEKATGIHFE